MARCAGLLPLRLVAACLSSPPYLLAGALASFFRATVGVLLSVAQRTTLLFTGFALFFDERYEEVTAGRAAINPLVCCMVAGFVTSNLTAGGHAFHEAVTDLSGPIYLLFFTFTGITMDLGVLWRNRSACILLFGSRSVFIVLGSRIGGQLGGQPAEYYDRYWMSFLTQAGVTLGLAQSVAPHFVWGPDFAACIVALVVCNQIVGPPLFKHVIKLVNESNIGYNPAEVPKTGFGPRIRNLGNVKNSSLGKPKPRGVLCIKSADSPLGEAITRRLRELQWEVLVADETFSLNTSVDESEQLEKRSRYNIIGLPDELQRELLSREGAQGMPIKPWEKLVAHRSMPTMPKLPISERDLWGGSPVVATPRRRADEALPSGWEQRLFTPRLWTGAAPTRPSPPSTRAASAPTRSSGPGCSPRSSSAPTPSASPPLRRARPCPGSTSVASTSSPARGRCSARGGRRCRSAAARCGGRELPFSVPARLHGCTCEQVRLTAGEPREPRRSPSSGSGGRAHTPRGRRGSHDLEDDPARYAYSMRLLWLAASMKNLDVILVLVSSDSECLEVCRLVNELMPMIERSRKASWSKPPQVVISLEDETQAHQLTPSPNCEPPLVIGPRLALPRLICEVLHPTAHYTGSFESSPLLDDSLSVSDLSDLGHMLDFGDPGPGRREAERHHLGQGGFDPPPRRRSGEGAGRGPGSTPSLAGRSRGWMASMEEASAESSFGERSAESSFGERAKGGAAGAPSAAPPPAAGPAEWEALAAGGGGGAFEGTAEGAAEDEGGWDEPAEPAWGGSPAAGDNAPAASDAPFFSAAGDEAENPPPSEAKSSAPPGGALDML